jgi:hypothetical protein
MDQARIMLDLGQVVGSIVLALMSIVFHILNQMPFKKGAYRRATLRKKILLFLFPRSPQESKPKSPFHRDALFWGMVCLSIAFIGLRAGMTRNYAITQYCFIAAVICSIPAFWMASNCLAKHARVFWTLVSAALLAVILAKLYGSICPRIVVGPSKVTFGKLNHEKFTFIVTNKDSVDLYSVQLKFKVDGSFLPDEYEFNVPLGSLKPVVPGSDFSDIGAMNCTNDQGIPIVMFFIQHMQPGERREIEFTHKILRTSVITATVTYFTEESQSIVNDPNTTLQHFNYPGEAIHCSQEVLFSMTPNAPKKKANVSVGNDSH